MIQKPKVAIASLTSDSGCQMRILDLEDQLTDILEVIDLVYFPMAYSREHNPPYDVTLVEGAVVQKKEIETIKWLRENSSILVALGTCATYGGVPSIKNFGFAQELEKMVYPDPTFLESINVNGIGNYVKVDYFIRGCPIDKDEFVKVLKFLLAGKLPVHINYPVCAECRSRGNPCYLVEEDQKLCLGPITYGGCNAPCPTNKIPCYGCRGPLPDGNVEALVNLFKRKGIEKDHIKRMFFKFAGTSKKFQSIGELL